MKKQTLFIIAIAVTFLCGMTSCQNELDYNLSNKEPQLVINALINADSLRNEVYVSYSDPYEAKVADDVIVRVYINNVLAQTVNAPEAITNGIAALYPINCKFNVNDRVKVDVTTKDGKKQAWAETTVLPKTPIEKVESFEKVYSKEILSFQTHVQFKITINDQSNNEDHFYRLVIDHYLAIPRFVYDGPKKITLFTYHKEHSMYINNDFALMDGVSASSDENSSLFIPVINNAYGIFNNRLFKNKSYTLNVSIPHYSYLSHANIRLLRISKDEYDYLKSLNIIDSEENGEEVNEPVTICTNVTGGLGIVAICSESSQKVIIDETIAPK